MNEPIAVVGLGCVLPDAFGPDTFWANTLAKRSSLRSLDGDEWSWPLYLASGSNGSERLPTVVGARIDGYSFDWRRFRMPPAEVADTNPMALMVLDAGSQCLDGVRTIPKDTTGVFIGATSLGYRKDTSLRLRLPDLLAAAESSPTLRGLAASQRSHILQAATSALCDRLRPITEDTAINTPASVAAGRIAMRFDLRGLHYAVDGSFASGLAALDVAVRSLRDGTLDMALAGAATEPLSPLEMLAFERLGMLGRERIASFDASADGTLIGEGVVMVALKRLSTARRDGDSIFALIRGVGASSDGTDMQLGEPSVNGRVAAMRRAYLDAEVDPQSVTLIECDAPGVVESERAEIQALARLHAGRAQASVALGSAKPVVGHLRAAAGAVGLLRAILALHQATLPPQTNFTTPHPDLALADSPFYIPTEAEAFRSTGPGPLRAAVNAFGLGGTSYHAVLEQYDPIPTLTLATAPLPLTQEVIAIVGMGAWLPGAQNVADFQTLLMDGRDMSGTVPPERWPADQYYDPDPRRSDTIYTKLGCFAPRPPVDSRWRIDLDDATIDPGQLMVLQAAEEALADAQFERRQWNPRRIAVSLGLMPFLGRRFQADMRVKWREFEAELEVGMRDAGLDSAQIASATEEAAERFKQNLPPITRESVLGWLGNIHAARLCAVMGFQGAGFTVDSACASTHAALHAGIQALRHRTCDVAVVGGVCSDLQPEYFVACCRFSALSATGITPFDATADGFIPGEGAGVLILRRLADAEKAGERVHALIRSVAGSSDGRGRSVLAPRSEGEALAMERALQEAAVDPSLVDYVECHGAGTAVGDVAEVEAYTFAYGRGRTRPLRIGSVKSNMGHLNGAAGAPAVIKTTLAVRDGVIPASLKLSRPNPRIDFAAGPVEVVTSTQSWVAPDGQPRRAGVSAFGVGGSNFHVLLEQYRGPTAAQDIPVRVTSRSDPRLPIFAAAGRDGEEALARLRSVVNGSPREASRAASDSVHRLALVAQTPAEASRRLRLAELANEGRMEWELLRHQGVFRGSGSRVGKLALLFPGQGSQYAGMLAELTGFSAVSAVLSEADTTYLRIAGRPLSPSVLEPSGGAISDEDSHCAVLVVNVAIQRLLEEFGVVADFVLGQSAGELAALVAARVLTLGEAVQIVRARTLSVLGLPTRGSGAMLAVACSAERARSLLTDLPGYAALAADNAPGACIVSVARAAVAALQEQCRAAAVDCRLLDISDGYHSQFIQPAQTVYRKAFEGLEFRQPTCEIVSSVTGDSLMGVPPAAYPDLLVEQLVVPVRFREAVEVLYARGCRLFLECGPRRSLTSFVVDTLGGRPHSAQPTLHPKVGELEQFSRAVAWAYANEVGDSQRIAH